MSQDYYSVLAVPRNATSQQIRERFRQLAKERHPDRFAAAEKGRAEEEFQEITEAFNVLINPQRRRQHDEELSRPVGQEDQSARLSHVYLRRGVKAYREKNYFEAAENFNRATIEDPENAKAWHHLALACSHQKRWLRRATAAIAKACELEPMKVSYLKLAGQLFARAGMTGRAEKYYNDALNWGGEDPEIRRALGELGKDAKRGRTGFFG